MRRHSFLLLAPALLLAVLASCQDHELPTALVPDGPAFDHLAGHCIVTSDADGAPAPAGSLREKIEDASCANITFDVTGTIALTSGELEIDRDLTITGPGAGSLAVSGNNASRVFVIQFGSIVSISGLTITGGEAPFSSGGGILNLGTLTLSHSTVSGNNSGGSGGGISTSGTLTLTHSTVSNNTADLAGGGIISNTSGDRSTTSTTIRNSTISGNTSIEGGGGIRNFNGLTRIVHSTISGNSAIEAGGGGVQSHNDEFTETEVKGTLIWGNTAIPDRPNDVGANHNVNRYRSLGHNLIGAAGTNVDFTLDFNQTGDLVNVADAKLGPLALNAPGTTQTHAVLTGSPALNAGTCADHLGDPVTTDQRGVSRPQGSACDIGAYEREHTASFTFSGFFAPVDKKAVNVARAGSAIPVKFSLGGDHGLAIFASDHPKFVFTTCPADESEDVVEETVAAGRSGLSYADGQYTYTWKTEKSWAGRCGTLTLKFTNGTSQSAQFRFTR